jgi:hypothetical protein
MSDTAETVALGLLELLLQNDKMAAELKERAPGAAKYWLFNSYAECLRAVLAGRERAAGTGGPRGPGLVAVADPEENDVGGSGHSA